MKNILSKTLPSELINTPFATSIRLTYYESPPTEPQYIYLKPANKRRKRNPPLLKLSLPKRRCSCDRCGRCEVVPREKKNILGRTSEFILDWGRRGYRTSLLRETRGYIDRWGRCRAKYYRETPCVRANRDESPTLNNDRRNTRTRPVDMGAILAKSLMKTAIRGIIVQIEAQTG